MKTVLLIAALLVAFVVIRQFFTGSGVRPSIAMEKVKAGEAVLIDIREPSEWTGGVVEAALLLPMSDFNGARTKWQPAMSEHKTKEWMIYCRSGTRASMVVSALRSEGFNAVNAGGFGSWKAAGVPVKIP